MSSRARNNNRIFLSGGYSNGGVLENKELNELKVRVLLDTPASAIRRYGEDDVEEVKEDYLFWNCKSIIRGGMIANDSEEFMNNEGLEPSISNIKEFLSELIYNMGENLAIDVVHISALPEEEKRDIIGWMRVEKKC